MELKDFLDLAQAGAVAILLYINRDLWKRLNELEDRIFRYLEQHHASAVVIQAQISELLAGKEKGQEETD